ncbi:tRNA (guanosine(37)-N1)-methyltransferase TrmD [Nocardioides marmorisolisilvae]|uniref:tRNA (guanine-N(1)-)-methyltransferase n=1 Tax=Nocardioides marmorisolisilvae TaxID=1542737 RepID=A0A3N0DW52_9ACTN|nr:tRNA (guanosine(37)-N1)-methyltransferase TrmD [Nocardioides marmorisolisilvae]RNL79849.1 tRNA (guanosine(37)-N1)-methyltransferase TrmD [Nocardioides marmorisolisilvae]
MRIDVVSIFPDYLAPLELSLPGKARENGLLDLHVHDLRRFTHDKHHTVDDTPYGGGAGMVMKPEPWGEALDAIAPDGAVLVVPTPSGTPFSQELAAELSTRDHLVFACGRYEGIDQRVLDEAATRLEVREVSLGDYVLNGGEVAALAVIEAVVRLIPGFMGNAESLVEESHADGLLEYPVYTKPASWRGHDVPEVLLSGDHGRIAAWRTEQSVRRTAQRRPDLQHPAGVLDDLELRAVRPSDAGEIFTLQRACWVQELQVNPGVRIHALEEDLETVRRWIGTDTVLVLRSAGRLVGAVRARLHQGEDGTATWDIGRLMVAPDLQGSGLGRQLLEAIEAAAPESATTFELFTGAGSLRNQKMYKKAGYRLHGPLADEPGAVRLSKKRR